MPTTKRATISLGVNKGRIEIDGQRLPGVTGFQLDASVDDIPRLTVDLNMHEVEVNGEMVMQVSEKAAAALIALGWTPPKDAA